MYKQGICRHNKHKYKVVKIRESAKVLFQSKKNF